MTDLRHQIVTEEVVPSALPDHEGQPPTAPPGGRWCPHCGADLSGVPVREEPTEEPMFAVAGRRLKVALSVFFVLVWLVVELYDWLVDPSTNFVPGWFSALGALMLFYLLGFNPAALWRRRG